MKFRIKNRPVSWLFWHPHQKLWNWSLVYAIQRILFIRMLSRSLINKIVWLDTFFLKMAVEKHLTHSSYKPRLKYTEETPINYFDLGTHKEANELVWIYQKLFSKLPNPVRIIAVEANPESHQKARKKLEEKKIPSTFLNVALIEEHPKSKTIKLYTKGSGTGDSIYKENFGNYIEVPTKKISEIVNEEGIDLENSINILRMNIEGAEYDVMRDLIKQNLLKKIDSFWGMWDDVSKIDYEKDKCFRILLKKYNINNVTFNGRDLKYSGRRKLIKNQMCKKIGLSS